MLAMHFPGFKVADVEHTHDRVRISISVDSDAATCPDCGRQSTAVHSVYVRQLRDLPILGEPVELQALVRRFRCRNSDCARITFSESLGWLAKRYAQRTDRVTNVLRSLVSMLSSTLSTTLAFAIGVRTSSSTLLRAVDRSYCLAGAPRVRGIDNFAIRRGRTYGTLLCDLETGRPVDILAGRTAEPVAQWISQHPCVEIVARDRATAYAQAVSSAAPGAIQVADRFHLVRNVNDAFREVIDGRRWVIPGIAVDTVPEPCAKKPECPTRSELARLAAATRLEDRYEEVWRLFHEGKSIRAISRATGLCRVTVRKYLQHTEVPRRAPRPQAPGKTTPFIGYLKQRWEAGCHNASQLFKEIRELGYDGSRSLVKAFVQPWRTQVDTRVAPVSRPAWKDVR